jgi:AraC-like DNA-binding protein
MDALRQAEAAPTVLKVQFNGMRFGLLGRVASGRGVEILATHGMPNGRTENHLNPDQTFLSYVRGMPADAIISRGRLPFRFVGALGLMGAGHPYRLRGSGPFTCAHCVFSSRFLSNLSETESELRINELNLVAPLESQRLTLLADAMWREAIAPGFGGSLFAEAMGMAVAVEIARLDRAIPTEEAPLHGSLAPAQAKALESYIRAHIDEDLTLNELALLIGVSVRRLSQAVKKAKGMSVQRWIARLRVAEAQRYLAATDLSMQEIARRCALRNVNAFASAFRAATGLSPSEFRRLVSNRSERLE